MNIEELKKLGVSEDVAEQVLAVFEKALSDKEAELEMASEKINEMHEENMKLAEKIKELSEENKALSLENETLSEEISELEQEKDKPVDDGSRTVNMGLKHGAAASGEQFGFRFTGIRDARRA